MKHVIHLRVLVMITKYCKKCDQTKEISEFGNDKRFSDGKRFYCKTCNSDSYKRWYYKDVEKSRDVSKQWRDNNLDKRKEIWTKYHNQDRANRLKSHYKIDYDRYLEMLESQNYVCAICQQPDPVDGKELAVDHDRSCCPDHKNTCGKCVRGLLCSLCNRSLGMLKDDIMVLRKAIEYLEGFSEVQK